MNPFKALAEMFTICDIFSVPIEAVTGAKEKIDEIKASSKKSRKYFSEEVEKKPTYLELHGYRKWTGVQCLMNLRDCEVGSCADCFKCIKHCTCTAGKAEVVDDSLKDQKSVKITNSGNRVNKKKEWGCTFCGTFNKIKHTNCKSCNAPRGHGY